MRLSTRRTLIGVVGAVLLAACGSTKTAAPASSPGDTKAGVTTTVAGAPNPNAPEQLPPGDIPDNQVFVT